MRTVLHTEASPGLGGQELRTLAEARWIAERGWRVILAAQPGGRLAERARLAGLEVAPVCMRRPLDLRAVRRLAVIIRAEGVSLVHTHSSVDAWVGGLAARVTRVPVVRTRHVSIPIRRHLNPVYRLLADRVITSAEAIRAMVIAAGARPDRVVTIPAGVDLAEYEGSPAAGADPVRELALGRPIVGSVAMFRGSKGHHDLLRAFAAVRERRPEATLLLVGDGGRRAWIEGLARQMGLEASVRFTGFRGDVPALLAAMDCFALASTRTEGVPQSLLQAFAAGVPVVATAVGGVPEVVVDGVTGLIVPPGDPPALARAIEAVLEDPPAARARAAAARRLVRERFSHATAVDRTLAVYEALVR